MRRLFAFLDAAFDIAVVIMMWLLCVVLTYAIAAAIFFGKCEAATLGLHLVSAHESPGFNNDNQGAYVRLDNGATFGAYRNSINNDTFYGGYTWQQAGGPFAVSLVALTGYTQPLVATIIPSVLFSVTDHVGARLSFVYSPDQTSAVHFSMEWRQ